MVEQGDIETWKRWLESSEYAREHDNQRFYDKFQKLLTAIHAKAEADIKLIRWLKTDIDTFRGNALAHMMTMGAEVAILLSNSDLNLVWELEHFLLDEYKRVYMSYMVPITIQEQLVRRYQKPVLLELEKGVVASIVEENK